MSGVIGGNGVITAGSIRLNKMEVNTATVNANLVADHGHFNNVSVNDTANIQNLFAENQTVTNVIHDHTYQNLHIGKFELEDASGTFVINKEQSDGTHKRLLELNE